MGAIQNKKPLLIVRNEKQGFHYRFIRSPQRFYFFFAVVFFAVVFAPVFDLVDFAAGLAALVVFFAVALAMSLAPFEGRLFI